MMNIWIEYFRYEDNRKNTHAQMREHVKWIPPDPKNIHKRFCQSLEEAYILAKSLFNQGYHATVKQDGYRSD